MTRAGAALAAAWWVLAACNDHPGSPPAAVPGCSSLAGAEAQDAAAFADARTIDVAAPQVHAFAVELARGEFLRATVEQHGIDLVLALLDGEGRQVVRVDTLNGDHGPERLPWIAERSGTHHLLVCAPAAATARGSYAASSLERRPPGEEDRLAVTAVRAFASAETFRRRPDEADEETRTAAAADAVARYREALGLWEALGDPRQLDALYRLGQIYDRLGEPETALGCYQRAAALFTRGADPLIEGAILHAVGRTHYALGDVEAARVAYQRALGLRRAAGDRSGEAATANNLGLALQQLGEVRAALSAFDLAVGRWREIGNRSEEAITLYNRGQAYFGVGDHDQAVADFQRSLAIRRALGEIGRQAWTLSALGLVHQQTGDFEQALDEHRQAVELHRRGGDRQGTAVSLNNLGMVDTALDRPGEALACFREALAIFEELDDRRNQALVLHNTGWALAPTDADRALADYRRALPLFIEFQDASHHITTRLGMAIAERRRGRLEAARQLIERALEDVERLRNGAAGQPLQSSLFATQQDHYDFYVDLLMELHRRDPAAGHDAAALTASERARARSQLDAMIDSGADPWGEAAPEVRQRLEELERDLRARELQRQELLQQGAAGALLAATEGKLRELLRQYDLARAEARAAGRTRQAPAAPPLLTADQIRRRVVDPETVLLEYNLGSERSYLWAVTPDEVKSFELPAGERIEEPARRAYRLLVSSRGRKGRGQIDVLLAELSDVLLGAVAGRLEGKRLLIVGEGALGLLPFAALPVPGGSGDAPRGGPAELVGERHEIVTAPSASALAVIRRNLESREPPPGRLAILADPVFRRDDPRVVRQPPPSTGEPSSPASPWRSEARSLDRLTYSRDEAQAMLDLAAPGDGVLAAFGFDADRELVVSGALHEYRILHFATHGKIDFEHPDLSRLVFSSVDEDGRERDGSLFVHQIYELDLPADLVVLSACRTALGRRIRGEGLLGLTQGFFDAGAAAVIVSLWSVDDQATAALMAHFYRGLLGEGMTASAALAAAQQEIRRQPRWRAPFYWAGFVLQGEWRTAD